MKQAYCEPKFRKSTLLLIDQINEIIDEYIADDYRLTVRQLYYQLVARGIIENTERSYKNTTELVNEARMCGLMDWDVIEDRTRSFIRRNHWANPQQILDSCAAQYYEDMWLGQPARVMVIVEKEALAGVLERVCHEFSLPLLAARGFPSGTVLREFALSDIQPTLQADQELVILHLGDHDPSGIDMSRDLIERLDVFTDLPGTSIDFRRIALNMDQILKQKPPPNPAKSTDSRYKDYKKKFGEESWELDALSPSFLNDLVRGEVHKIIDFDLWNEAKQHIMEVRRRIKTLAQSFKKE